MRGRNNVMNKILMSILVSGLLVLALPGRAGPVSVGDNDSLRSILTAQMGKRVAVKIKSGEEMTGTVRAVTKDLTHLGELAGKEFYDAVIVNKAIEAVIIRVK
jgi:hypothetical protein